MPFIKTVILQDKNAAMFSLGLKEEIQSRILTEIFGKAVVVGFNQAFFVLNTADKLHKYMKAVELKQLYNTEPNLVREKAQIEARREIIRVLSLEMERTGQNSSSLEFYLHSILKRSEEIRSHNTRVMQERGCSPKDDHPAISQF